MNRFRKISVGVKGDRLNRPSHMTTSPNTIYQRLRTIGLKIDGAFADWIFAIVRCIGLIAYALIVASLCGLLVAGDA